MLRATISKVTNRCATAYYVHTYWFVMMARDTYVEGNNIQSHKQMRYGIVFALHSHVYDVLE